MNKLDILPFLSWRKDRSRPASSSMLLCRTRMDMPIEKMNLNCSKLEMITGGGPAAAARPPVPVTSPSPSQLKSARVCTLSHNITQFERRKGRSAGPAPAAAGAAARPVPLSGSHITRRVTESG